MNKQCIQYLTIIKRINKFQNYCDTGCLIDSGVDIRKSKGKSINIYLKRYLYMTYKNKHNA